MRGGGRAHSGVPGASLAQNQEESGTAGVRQRNPVHALITRCIGVCSVQMMVMIAASFDILLHVCS